MKNFKKALLISLIPIFSLVLSGCGFQKPVAPASQTNEAVVPAQNQVKNNPEAATAQKKEALPALPADDKAAIDGELADIDKELKTTNDLIDTNDLSDANLGL